MENLIAANIKSRPTRAVISILAVALGIILLLIIGGITKGTLDDYLDRTISIGSDLILQQKGSDALFAFSDVCGDRGEPVTEPSITPADITEIASQPKPPNIEHRVITWKTTGNPTYSKVLYRIKTDPIEPLFDWTETTQIKVLTENHQVILTGLSRGQIYEFSVASGGISKYGSSFTVARCSDFDGSPTDCDQYSESCQWEGATLTCIDKVEV